nr:hypothetical protein [Chromobacterium sp. ASV5]
MTLSIREAGLADADALADIYLACRREMPYAPLAHDEASVRRRAPFLRGAWLEAVEPWRWPK